MKLNKTYLYNQALHKLGLIRKADADNAIKTYKDMADNDSRLAADLVEECRTLSSQIDELVTENERLKKQITRLVDNSTGLEHDLDDAKQRLSDKAWDVDKLYKYLMKVADGINEYLSECGIIL